MRSARNFQLIKMQEYEGNVVHVQRGLQLDRNFTFSHPVRTAVHTGEHVVVHLTAGNEHVILEKPLKAKEIPKKFRIDACINKIVHIKKYQWYIAFCNDLYLRIFTQHFKLLQSIPVTNTILSLAFNEVSNVLYAGGTGQVSCWFLKNQLDEPLVAGRPLQFKIAEKEWVVDISFSRESPVLCIACANSVYLANIKSHEKFYYIPNPHLSTITSATLYTPYHYIITCAKDGSIKVWSYILHVELQTLTGHCKPVTAIRLHSTLPYVVSTSLDGTIRLWNIQSLTQSQKYDVNLPIMDMSLATNGDIVCHTNHNIMLLGISQVESVLSLVNSHITRLAIPTSTSCGAGSTEHVMTMTEDGGVRIISLETGLSLTILFPMLSMAIIADTVYCPIQKLMYGLLLSGRVLVFTTQTNPCTMLEAWTPVSDEEQVTCMTRLVLGDDPIIVGGLISGFISVLHSTCAKGTGQLCPAHDGKVTHLVSHQPMDGDRNHPLLASCGKDQLIQIWAVQMKKEIAIKNLGCISLDYAPAYISLLQSHLCVATPDNQLFVYDLDDLEASDSINISHLQPVTHSQDDSHYDDILSLSANSQLNIFASSSKDGRIKVWDVECQLLSEIELGLSLTRLCFDVATGNILLGFQQQLCMISAAKYLPFQRLSRTKVRKRRDVLECPVPFDETTTIWHDTEHVTTMPMLAAPKLQSMDTVLSPLLRRMNKLAVTPPPPRLFFETSMTKRQCSSRVKRRSAAARRSNGEPSPTLVLPSCATVPDRIIIPALNVDELTDLKADEALLCTDYFKAMIPSNESLAEEKSRQDLLRIESDSFESLTGRRKALVSPLKNRDNLKYQIAPDGYVPNSVIRGTFGKEEVSDIDSPHVYPLLFLRRNQENCLARLRSRRRARTLSSKTRSGTSDLSSIYTTTPSPTLTIDEEDEFVEANSSGTSKLKARKESPKVSGILDFSDFKKMEGLDPEKTSSSNKYDIINKYDTLMDDKDYEEEEISPGMMIIDITKSKKHGPSSSNNEPLTRSPTSTVDTAKYKQDPPTFPSFKFKTKFGTQQQMSEKTPSTINIPRQASTSQEGLHSESFLKSKSRRSSSMKSVTSQPNLGRLKRESRTSSTILEKDHSHISSNLSQDISETIISKSISGSSSSERLLKSLLRQIINSPWFGNGDEDAHTSIPGLPAINSKSQLSKTKSGTISTITNKMINVLMTTDDSSIFKDVCSLLSELDSAKLVNKAAKQEILNGLLKKSEGELPGNARRDLLHLLGQLGIVNSQALLTVLQSLTDEDEEVRSAAFSTLKILTGVENRQQLHQLLVDHRFMQHTELDEKQVLNDLADRMKKSKRNLHGPDHSVSLLALGDRYHPINCTTPESIILKTLSQRRYEPMLSLGHRKMTDGSPPDRVVQLGQLKVDRLANLSQRANRARQQLHDASNCLTSSRYNDGYVRELRERLKSPDRRRYVDQPVDLVITPYHNLSTDSTWMKQLQGGAANTATASDGMGACSMRTGYTAGLTVASYDYDNSVQVTMPAAANYSTRRQGTESDGRRVPMYHDRTSTVLKHLNSVATREKEAAIIKATTGRRFRQTLPKEEDIVTRAMSLAIEEITDQMMEHVSSGTGLEEMSGKESGGVSETNMPVARNSYLPDHMTYLPHTFTRHMTGTQDHMTGVKHKTKKDHMTTNQFMNTSHVIRDYGSSTRKLALESRAMELVEHEPTLADVLGEPNSNSSSSCLAGPGHQAAMDQSIEQNGLEGAIPPPSTRLSHHRLSLGLRPSLGVVHRSRTKLQQLPTRPTKEVQHASMTVGYRTLLRRMAAFPHSKNALGFMLDTAGAERGRREGRRRTSSSNGGDEYVWNEVFPLLLRANEEGAILC